MFEVSYYKLEKLQSFRKTRFCYILQIVAGFLSLAFLSRMEIPIQPVPITLQTFALFAIGLYLKKEQALYAVLAYLVAAAAGFPVLSGAESNPFWFSTPSAGFCFAFPVAAYVTAAIMESKKKFVFFWTIVSVLASQTIIYFFGVTWLSYFFGFQDALAFGFYPFLPIAAVKMAAAISVKMTTHKLNNLIA